MRIGGGVRQVDRFCGLADQADQTFTLLQTGGMDRVGVQALGGEKFQRLAGAAQIDRADLGHHVGGDDRDQLVQPHLGGGLLRHDLAQAAQQQARSPTGRHQARPSESAAKSMAHAV
jgi:hypothetical protein